MSVKSMTGFGRGVGSFGGLDFTIDIKSVNHRFFDFSARIYKDYAFLEEPIKKPHLTVNIQPADLAGIHPFVKFFLGEIRDIVPHQGDGFLTAQRVIRRSPQHHLPLGNHTVPQSLRLIVPCQPAVNEPDGTFKIAI